MITQANEKKILMGIGFVFVIAMVFCSSFTSPLYPNYYGDDSAVFVLIGKAIVNGKIVYKDLFDHKGPILFFIEAIGYSISERTGIWIIQCIFGLFTLLFVYRTWKLIKK